MGVSHKWLNCYWVYSWRVLLSLAFALALCSKAAFSDIGATYGSYANTQLIDFDCSTADSVLQSNINNFTDVLESYGCINISVSKYCDNPYLIGTKYSNCGSKSAVVVGFADPEIPNSCFISGYPLYQSIAQGVSVVTLNAQCLASFRPSTPINCDPGTSPGHFSLVGTCVDNTYVYPDSLCQSGDLDPQRSSCLVKCGTADNILDFACYSDDYEHSITHSHCFCKTDLAVPDCDFKTGEGCATYDKQRQNLTALQRIEAEISRGTLHYSGIDGVLRKNDGTFTDIKTLLTQIANSPGVLSPGDGSAGGTGGSAETPETAAWTPPTLPEGNAMLTRSQQIDNEIQAKKLLLSQTSQTVKEGLLARMAITNAPTGVGGLPCWRGLSLYQGRTFDICFTDWEEHLYVIPNVIFTAALILAAFFVIRKKV